ASVNLKVQWVYTAQYGWVRLPYASAHTFVPNLGNPYSYVHYFIYGRQLALAPWVFGEGEQSFWGIGTTHWSRGILGGWTFRNWAQGRPKVRTSRRKHYCSWNPWARFGSRPAKIFCEGNSARSPWIPVTWFSGSRSTTPQGFVRDLGAGDKTPLSVVPRS